MTLEQAVEYALVGENLGHNLQQVSVRDFYDGLAADYHLVFENWDAAIQRQGEALDRLIRALHKNAVDVLDCSCGIATQAIALARLGYRVQGTDISERSLERARLEAARLGVAAATQGVCSTPRLGQSG